MTVKEQIDFWNSLPEEEQNKEVTVCGLTVEEVMKLKVEREKMKCCGNCKHCYSKNDEENVITCAYDDEFAYLSLRKCYKWELR